MSWRLQTRLIYCAKEVHVEYTYLYSTFTEFFKGLLDIVDNKQNIIKINLCKNNILCKGNTCSTYT